jgi:hypothetical protein
LAVQTWAALEERAPSSPVGEPVGTGQPKSRQVNLEKFMKGSSTQIFLVQYGFAERVQAQRPFDFAVSAHPGETGDWSQTWHRNASRARKKPKASRKYDLQISGAGRKSQKITRVGRGQQMNWEIPIQ